MKKTIEEEVLTPELFQEIISGMTEETIELKRLQGDSVCSIAEQKENLKQLKDQYKTTRNELRLTKRGLRNEKRKLKKVNKTLNIQSSLFVEINDKFTSGEETYINVKRYLKAKNEG